MIEKIANLIEMSFEISDSDKKIANQCVHLVTALNNKLDIAKNHLDIIYNPFKKATEIPQDLLIKKRGKLSIFKQRAKKNFGSAKKIAFLIVYKLNNFASDLHVTELISTFKDSIETLEKNLFKFFDNIDNYRNPEFKDNLIKSIEAIFSDIAEIKKLTDERIISFIDTNILANNWISNTGDSLKLKIENKIPLIQKLFDERNNALNGIQQNMEQQTLNPGNLQAARFPQSAQNLDIK